MFELHVHACSGLDERFISVCSIDDFCQEYNVSFNNFNADCVNEWSEVYERQELMLKLYQFCRVAKASAARSLEIVLYIVKVNNNKEEIMEDIGRVQEGCGDVVMRYSGIVKELSSRRLISLLDKSLIRLDHNVALSR